MMRLFRFDDPEHGEANELLPWLVNGTLDGLERTRVERHVAECVACSQEVDDLRALQAAVALDDDADRQATQALARIKARVHTAESRRGAKRGMQSIVSQWGQTNRWVRYAVLAQFVLLAVMAAALLQQPTPQYYHSLGAAPKTASPGSGVVVVFNEALAERDMRSLLLRLHARIVDGPSPAGAYTLQVPQEEQATALALLRHTSSVVFAEPAPKR
jgi:anti-sigma factor RsiW